MVCLNCQGSNTIHAIQVDKIGCFSKDVIGHFYGPLKVGKLDR